MILKKMLANWKKYTIRGILTFITKNLNETCKQRAQKSNIWIEC